MKRNNFLGNKYSKIGFIAFLFFILLESPFFKELSGYSSFSFLSGLFGGLGVSFLLFGVVDGQGRLQRVKEIKRSILKIK